MAIESSKKAIKKKRFSIQYTAVSIFLFATLFTATVAICLQFYFSKQLAHEYALNSFSVNAQATSKHLNMIDRKARNAVELLSKYTPIITENFVNHNINTIFSDVIRNNPYFYSVYVGFPSGDYYEVVNLDANSNIRKKIKASHKDRWVVVYITEKEGVRTRIFTYYDDALNRRVSRSENSDYVVTKRPWYINAKHNKIHQTEPYLFQNIGASGQTYSAKIVGTEVVVAVDIALGSISEYLQDQKSIGIVNSQNETYLYTSEGEIIASDVVFEDKFTLPASKPLVLSAAQKQVIKNAGSIKVSNETAWAPVDFSVAGQPQGYSIDILNLIAEMTGLQFEYINGFTWSELRKKFVEGEIDLLHSLIETANTKSLGQFSEPFLSLPFFVVTKPDAPEITHISQLDNHSLAIPKGWTIIPIIEEYYPNIQVVVVESTLESLKYVQSGKAYAGIDNGAILTYIAKEHFIDGLTYHKNITFNAVNVSTDLRIVLPEKNTDLLNIINLALKHISAEQKSVLMTKWFNTEGDNSNSMLQSTVPYKAMVSLAPHSANHNKLLTKEINGEDYYVYISPVSAVKEYYFAILVPVNRVMKSIFNKIKYSVIFTILCLLLLLPICWIFAKPIVRPIKRLEAENKKIMNRDFDSVEHIDTRITELDELACSLVDMSQSIKQYQHQQKVLMESIIQLIAEAIDDKSAYTAGHCNRVPELGIMLADVASNSTAEGVKDFTFKNEDEIHEFRIAAWLHDCGKIITPEHIVDKGSKLEAIYNRIHEIRMRFEVLRRDAHINYYEKRLNSTDKSPEFVQALQAELEERYAQLDVEYTFVANANVGGEMMKDEDVSRLHEIAEQTWLRHYDDQVGLSPVEEMQLTSDSKVLPVTEKLLADKPEHIVVRTKGKTYDPKFGIKVDIPANEANIGELYNLSISRGTLTAEDRFKINEHIIGTIKMLDRLPFPPELSRVPRYASTHHETLKGTGYPRKLTAEDLSIPERILVLADIFEALTAADRPYKKAKPLSVSIRILHNMAKDDHVDMDLFKLFLSSGIYKTYADKFLKPEQLDEVDVEAYLKES